MDKDQVHQIMMEVPESWRYRWCGGGPCGCMGCSNVSGMVTGKGVTKEQWEDWVASNPEPEPEPNMWMPDDDRTPLQRKLSQYFAAKTIS
jgi:hypothetical protein